MESIGKARWFVESRFADDIALDDVAAVEVSHTDSQPA